jgi:hypothetical protein
MKLNFSPFQTSELDFLEWSPNGSEKLLSISDNMTTDTLFSTLTQYPFPDSREIGKFLKETARTYLF